LHDGTSAPLCKETQDIGQGDDFLTTKKDSSHAYQSLTAWTHNGMDKNNAHAVSLALFPASIACQNDRQGDPSRNFGTIPVEFLRYNFLKVSWALSMGCFVSCFHAQDACHEVSSQAGASSVSLCDALDLDRAPYQYCQA